MLCNTGGPVYKAKGNFQFGIDIRQPLLRVWGGHVRRLSTCKSIGHPPIDHVTGGCEREVARAPTLSINNVKKST